MDRSFSAQDDSVGSARERGRPRKSGNSAVRPPREEILRAAAQLFAERGYDGTSTGQIAESVGLTQPALFYHFESKEDLFREIAETSLNESLGALKSVLASSCSPGAKIYQQIFFQVTHDLNFPYNISSILNEGVRIAKTPAFSGIIAKERQYAKQLIDLIARGVTSGQFRNVDPFSSAMAILGMINWSVRWFRSGARLSDIDIASHFAEFALAALLQRPSKLRAVKAEAEQLKSLKTSTAAR